MMGENILNERIILEKVIENLKGIYIAIKGSEFRELCKVWHFKLLIELGKAWLCLLPVWICIATLIIVLLLVGLV